jgi:hypothetical protein
MSGYHSLGNGLPSTWLALSYLVPGGLMLQSNHSQQVGENYGICSLVISIFFAFAHCNIPHVSLKTMNL